VRLRGNDDEQCSDYSMPLTHEIPNYAFVLRNADGRSAKINGRVLSASFILSPMQLIEHWTATSANTLTAADLAPLLAMTPELVLLGTGEKQTFPPAAIIAMCLTRGIGIEVMNNAAAARTFNVLASEGRRVVAGFLLSPPSFSPLQRGEEPAPYLIRGAEGG
jgi:uncharacterized protein